MKLIRPRFYDDFICIADRCTDNCCIGWEIDIDPISLERFDAVSGEFGDRLRSAIRRGDVCTFAFGEGERCALLREDGLCELILHEGDDSLCDICALHPRFFGWYNDRKEAGLGLCCEEVCRLLFSDSTPLTFVDGTIDEEWEKTCSEELLAYLTAARAQLFSILQDRSQPLGSRFSAAAAYVRRLQDHLDNGDMTLPEVTYTSAEKADILPAMTALCDLFDTTESISGEWDARAAKLSSEREQLAENFASFLESSREDHWRYEHLAVYFCYRYFLGGVFEGEVVSRFGFALISVFAVMLFELMDSLDGSLSEWQRILDLKLYSKQMEYSEDNVELALDAVWDVPELSPEYIASCFVS